MSLTTRALKCAIPLFAAISFSMLAISPATADTPRVIVNGVGDGQLQLNNPVRFEGVAQDPQGIKLIYGTIQNEATGQYITQAGRSSKDPQVLKFKFTPTKSTRWASQAFNLPRGRYVFRIKVTDGQNTTSPLQEVPFIATGNKGPAVAAAPATNQRATAAAPAAGAAPRIAIQFPQNGARLAKAAAFSGIAKDDQAVVGVIATIMNTSTGMFLAPNGQFARSGELKLRTIKGKNAQWSTPQVNLPPGDYLLSVKAIDNGGQEGQWAQSKFSIAKPAGQAAAQAATQTATQTATQATQTTAIAVGATAANGMAYCSNQGMDADGDGFGWQNNASCVVAGSKADTHPTCASSASDPDGDGYGWENEKSCIVVVHCASANSDPDGDGFGWENNRSCIVLKQTSNSQHQRCAQGAASDPDGDGYGWENNKTCIVQ